MGRVCHLIAASKKVNCAQSPVFTVRIGRNASDREAGQVTKDEGCPNDD